MTAKQKVTAALADLSVGEVDLSAETLQEFISGVLDLPEGTEHLASVVTGRVAVKRAQLEALLNVVS